VNYNTHMKKITGLADAIRLIRFAAILWLGYLIVLVIINQTLGPPQRTGILYYVFYSVIAIICLGLAYWPSIQERLKRSFIPIIITISTVMPLIVNWAMIKLFPLVPQASPDDSYLIPFPFLFMGLLLVAWQYRWQYILLVILVITGLNLGVMWSFRAPHGTPFGTGIPFQGPLIAALIQTVIFFAVAFSISYLMNRLRKQQQSLEAANKNLTHYASTLEQLATSQERNRLARELHDTLAHTLSGLSVQLEAVKAYWDVDQTAARSRLEQSLASAHSGLEETRRALKALRASPLDDLGLTLAISDMAQDAAARANLVLDLSVMDNLPTLSPDVEQGIYRIAQEAITNAVNHAYAKNLAVKLEHIEGKMRLTVRDDGVGFDIGKNIKSSHLGLTGMTERTQLIGGELSIISKPGNGTEIKLTI
jgi:signal transduction histidine kinase